MVFDLKSIKKTKRDDPPRLLIYGPHKIGKSTFASCAESPIFIQTEDGLSDIDASAFPLCESWPDVMSCVDTLANDKHDFRTVVVDSADWAEQLSQKEVLEENNVKSLGDIDYGKGYLYAAYKFNDLLVGLNSLRLKRNMQVILLAHVEVRKFDDPMADSYDRYQIKLQKGVSKKVQEWADLIGFAQLEQMTTVDKGSGFSADRTRSIDTGRRILRVAPNAVCDAGSRYDLPPVLPFVWQDFSNALKEARNG